MYELRCRKVQQHDSSNGREQLLLLRRRNIQRCRGDLLHEVRCRVLRGDVRNIGVYCLSRWNVPHRCGNHCYEPRRARRLRDLRSRDV